MEQYIWLIPLGLVVGTYGTLIGAGGGFVLLPVLLLLYPHENPEIITSISLAVVFVNAFSGSLAYARMKRIDYRSGLLLAGSTVPGAILGALSTAYVPRRTFDAVLGFLMIITSVFLFFYSSKEKSDGKKMQGIQLKREMSEKGGTLYRYSYNPIVGSAVSFVIGFVASFLGIGGGIIHVPVLIYLLNFPVHIATATSHFILAILALTGTVVHISTGSFSHGFHRAVFLAAGVLIGAQAGALISDHVKGKWIIKSLAVALGFVGIRILFLAFS